MTKSVASRFVDQGRSPRGVLACWLCPRLELVIRGAMPVGGRVCLGFFPRSLECGDIRLLCYQIWERFYRERHVKGNSERTSKVARVRQRRTRVHCRTKRRKAQETQTKHPREQFAGDALWGQFFREEGMQRGFQRKRMAKLPTDRSTLTLWTFFAIRD